MLKPVAEHLSRHRILLLAAVVVLALAASRMASLQAPEATALALLCPLIASVLALRELSGIGQKLGMAGLAILAIALLGSELELGRALFPPAPIAEATITTANPDATLELPAETERVMIETHARLPHGRGGAEGDYALELERNGQKNVITGSFQKSSSAARLTRRRAPSSGPSHVIDIDRHEIDLPGGGPLHAHLITLSGAIGSALDVRVRPPTPGRVFVEILLIAIAVGALVVETLGARSGTKTTFAAFVATSVALALYLPRHFSLADPLAAVIAALVVAILAGGIGGYIVGQVLKRLLARNA